MNIFLKVLLPVFMSTLNGLPAIAREIQCSVYDAFDKPEGAMQFVYEDNKKILTLARTMGESAVFMDSEYAWIREAVRKPASDISKDPSVIWVKHAGEYNWEFKINRQNGTIQVSQTRMQMYWKGRCRLIDRSNKF